MRGAFGASDPRIATFGDAIDVILPAGLVADHAPPVGEHWPRLSLPPFPVAQRPHRTVRSDWGRSRMVCAAGPDQQLCRSNNQSGELLGINLTKWVY